jgi:hypothetical protein
VLSVRCRPRALTRPCLDQALVFQALQQGVEQQQFGPTRDQAGAELAEHGVVEAGIGEGEAERVLPVDPAPHGVGRLAVG